MSRPRHVVAIVNSASSAGRTLGRLPQISACLHRFFKELELHHTEGPGHATLLSRHALEMGADLVLSIGGDGTNNEVLCGFVDEQGHNRFPEAELGFVPSGTGSDFQRMLGTRPFDSVIEAMVDATHRTVDYGVARFVDHEGHDCVRPFLNIVSAGISGAVDYEVRRSNKVLGPMNTYVLGAIRAILRYRRPRVRMIIDDQAPRFCELVIAVAANGQYFGGGMWVAPMAACDDGKLELIVAEGMSRSRMMWLLTRLFRGQHLHNRGVFHRSIRCVRIEPLDPRQLILLDLDGEQPGRLPATFEIMPAALRLRLPVT